MIHIIYKHVIIVVQGSFATSRLVTSDLCLVIDINYIIFTILGFIRLASEFWCIYLLESFLCKQLLLRTVLYLFIESVI